MPRESSLASLPTCRILPQLPEQPAHPSVETLATEKLGHVASLVTIAECIRSTVEKSKPSMDCNDIEKNLHVYLPLSVYKHFTIVGEEIRPISTE